MSFIKTPAMTGHTYAPGWFLANNEDCTRETKPSRDLYLLREARVPAVIVECGFLSNPEEESLLQDTVYQSALATAIANGIKSFKKSV